MSNASHGSSVSSVVKNRFAPGLTACIYDVECYPNFFLIGVLDYDTGVVTQFSTEPGIGGTLAEARIWFQRHQHEDLWIGFNSLGYDNVMMRAALIEGVDDPATLYALSQRTIATKRVRLEQIDREIGVDILSIHGGALARIGTLKECGVKCDYGWLQELPYRFDTGRTHAQMVVVAKYNVHDLRITALTAEKSKAQILARLALADEFGLPGLRNRHDAGVAVAVLERELFAAKPEWSAAVAWQCSANQFTKHFQYRTPALIELHQRMAAWEMRFQVETTVTAENETEKTMISTGFADAVTVRDVGYRIGVGGLHSVDGPGIFEADAEHCLLDFDVASFYPALMINFGLHPEHLAQADFIRAFAGLRDRRLAAKKAGHTALADGLKISINSVFGKTKSPYSWICDPVMNVAVTLLGQLTLLLMVDTMADVDSVEVVSANTDGVTFRVRREDAEAVKVVMHDLAKTQGLELDVTEYRLLCRRDVNNYLAVKMDGAIKGRGAYAYNTADLGKKSVNRVVIDAVQQYFVHGVPLAETIRACQDIRAFIDYFKCTRGYSIRGADGSEHGGIARWYLGTDGVHLDKVKLLDGTKTQIVEAGAVVINELPTCLPANVAYTAYEALAERLVQAITEPPVRASMTIPLEECSREQMVRFQHNLATEIADVARCTAIDLTAVAKDYAATYKGSGYDSMKAIAVRLWLAGAGELTRGDLLCLCSTLDEGTGYFSGKYARTLVAMTAWVARDISPFPLPTNDREQIERALVWARDNVAPAKVKRKMYHHGAGDTRYIANLSIQKYAKTKKDYPMACAICASSVKHDAEPNVDFLLHVFEDIKHAVETHNFKPASPSTRDRRLMKATAAGRAFKREISIHEPKPDH